MQDVSENNLLIIAEIVMGVKWEWLVNQYERELE